MIHILRGTDKIRQSLNRRIPVDQIPPDYGGTSVALGQSPEQDLLRQWIQSLQDNRIEDTSWTYLWKHTLGMYSTWDSRQRENATTTASPHHPTRRRATPYTGPSGYWRLTHKIPQMNVFGMICPDELRGNESGVGAQIGKDRYVRRVVEMRGKLMTIR